MNTKLLDAVKMLLDCPALNCEGLEQHDLDAIAFAQSVINEAKNNVRPLPEGTEIEYNGVHAIVVEDTGGNSLRVSVGNDTPETWYWIVDGIECTVVHRAQ